MNDVPPNPPEKSTLLVPALIAVVMVLLMVAVGWLAIHRSPARRAGLVHGTAPVAKTPTGPDGIADGATLGVLPVTIEDEPDESAVKRFVLHIPIKARSGEAIDLNSLTIHVLFYDLIDGKRVVDTSAAIVSRWATPPADWMEKDTEELLVDYRLPKLTSKGDAPPEDRKYYGYIVRLYYRQQLQAAIAQPALLAEKHPPASTLPPVTAGRRASASPPPANSVDVSTALPGIAIGSTLGLLPVTTEDRADADSARRFLLHIPITARPTAHIAMKDVVVHVLFYDLLNGQTVVGTAANVKTHWLTPPADWTHADTEELVVEYQLPKPEAGTPENKDRKYYGYIVRVYYQQRLQAATADPERLFHAHPAPATLPQDPPSEAAATTGGTQTAFTASTP